MNTLRWILVALSVIFGGIFINEGFFAHPYLSPRWPYITFPLGCALNIYYLVASSRISSTKLPSRFWRLIDLWLSAKEAELRKRAAPKQ